MLTDREFRNEQQSCKQEIKTGNMLTSVYRQTASRGNQLIQKHLEENLNNLKPSMSIKQLNQSLVSFRIMDLVDQERQRIKGTQTDQTEHSDKKSNELAQQEDIRSDNCIRYSNQQFQVEENEEKFQKQSQIYEYIDQDCQIDPKINQSKSYIPAFQNFNRSYRSIAKRKWIQYVFQVLKQTRRVDLLVVEMIESDDQENNIIDTQTLQKNQEEQAIRYFPSSIVSLKKVISNQQKHRQTFQIQNININQIIPNNQRHTSHAKHSNCKSLSKHNLINDYHYVINNPIVSSHINNQPLKTLNNQLTNNCVTYNNVQQLAGIQRIVRNSSHNRHIVSTRMKQSSPVYHKAELSLNKMPRYGNPVTYKMEAMFNHNHQAFSSKQLK